MEGLAKDLVNNWQRTEERKGSSVSSASIWPRSCNEEKPKRRKVGKGKEYRPTQSPETQAAKHYLTLRQKRVRVQGFGSPRQTPVPGHWTHPPKWCGHGYSFSERVFPQDPQTHVWLCLGRDRPLPLREASQNSPSKVRLTWTGPKGVLKRAPRGMIATALSIWSMMDTKRVSSLIWTWGVRRQAILPGCCAHSSLVQGPLNHHSIETMSMENHAGQDLCFLLSRFLFSFLNW